MQDVHKKFATGLGLLLILLGILGFLFQELTTIISTTTIKNTTYLLLGAIITYIGVWGSTKIDHVVLRIVGMLFLIIALFGFMQPEPIKTWFAATMLDSIFHIIVGIAAIGIARCYK